MAGMYIVVGWAKRRVVAACFFNAQFADPILTNATRNAGDTGTADVSTDEQSRVVCSSAH